MTKLTPANFARPDGCLGIAPGQKRTEQVVVYGAGLFNQYGQRLGNADLTGLDIKLVQSFLGEDEFLVVTPARNAGPGDLQSSELLMLATFVVSKRRVYRLDHLRLHTHGTRTQLVVHSGGPVPAEWARPETLRQRFELVAATV